MSERLPSRPPLHQPPNPADLRRLPPANSECARVRGMMRDFADGDLSAAELRSVEEHAHGCHACAVELSRAEHEVVRLRRVFAQMLEQEQRIVRPLGKDFAARVLDRLVLDDTTQLPASPSTEGEAAKAVGGAGSSGAAEPTESDAAGGAALRRPAASNGLPGGVGTADLRPAAAVWLLAIAALLFVVMGGAALFVDGNDRAPERKARLVLTQAKGATGLHGRRWVPGEGLGESQYVSVGAGGGAQIDWHDVTSLSQPAATLTLDANGSLRLQDGAPMLLNGTMRVETHRPVTVAVEDGTMLQLGIGEYVIAADAVDSLGADKYQPSMQDPLASAPADLRVEVEVLRGDAATIVRTETGSTLIAQGRIGVYEGGGVVATRPLGAPAATAEFGGRGPVASAPSIQPTLTAFVHERSGVPSVGTVLGLAYAAGSSPRYAFGTTNANGTLLVAPEVPVQSDFLVLQALPASTRLELGIRAPDAYRLLHQGVEARCASSLVLDLSPVLFGTVVDETGQPRLGARILPCVVDELFGTMLPLKERLAYSDEEGQFRIHQLPVALPHHQYLALLVAHPNLRSLVLPVPARGSAAALLPLGTIVLRSLRAVKLHMLPANATVQVLEEVDGLPLGSATWLRTFTTDSQGRVNVASVGAGDLWWRMGSENNAVVQKFVLDDLGPLPRYRPSQVSSSLDSMFDPQAPLVGTDLSIASTYRHQSFVHAPSTGSAATLALLTVDSLGRGVPDAQVFAVTPTGPRGRTAARFLGFTSTNGVISLEPVSEGGDIVVIAPDGSTAFVATPQQAFLTVTAPLSTLGRVMVMPSLRPTGNASDTVVPIRFTTIGPFLPGMEVVAYRFACEATGWEVGALPPGTYRAYVGANDPRMIIVPAGGFAYLQ